MKPSAGVAMEVIALAVLFYISFLVPSGVPFLLYIVVAELLSTYLIHCPAHYVVGRALGIQFAGMKLGRTTLAEALPPRFSPFARLLPVITLRTERTSMVNASKNAKAAMFASGTVSSIGIAFATALFLGSAAGPLVLAASWLIAFAYLVFDLVFSPKSGDLMRARRALE